jgi:hypothetical protein
MVEFKALRLLKVYPLSECRLMALARLHVAAKGGEAPKNVTL